MNTMSPAERRLWLAACEARAYFSAKVKGEIGVTFRGGSSFTDLQIGRSLDGAIKAFETEHRPILDVERTIEDAERFQKIIP